MRRVLIIVIVVASLALGVWTYWYRTGSRVHIPSGPALSIDVFLVPHQQRVATITNAAGLTAVMSALRSGRPAQPHACAARGTMEARFADGRTLSVAFAPGHELSHYEFGMDGHSFTIARSKFLGALQAGGVDVQKIPTE